jgi:hypothetical protein
MSTNSDVVQRAFESLLVQSRAHKARPPTIAAVAARARISRSSIYRFHSGVVAQIRALNGERDFRKQDQLRVKAQLLTAQLRSEKELTRALARACSELAADKAAMKEELDDRNLSLQLRVEHLERQLHGNTLKLVRSK